MTDQTVPASTSAIRNTTDEMRDPANALLFLLESMDSTRRGDPSGAIYDMEAAGQRQLVNSDRLPVDSHGTDADFIAAGFTLGDPDSSDPLFRPATLPAGWSRRPTDHSMWSEIVDALGRMRVAIFYKAAFYDRRAFMRLETPSSYLESVLYESGSPVLDDEWLTADVARETLETIAANLDKEAIEADGHAARQPDNDYWPGRAAEHRAKAAQARAVAASLQAQS